MISEKLYRFLVFNADTKWGPGEYLNTGHEAVERQLIDDFGFITKDGWAAIKEFEKHG